MSQIIKVKKAAFYHTIDNRFNITIEKFSGHGIVSSLKNETFVGNIINPTGLIPAVFYKTGILTAQINDGSGFFNWSNLELSGIGEINKVFANYITGAEQSKNTIEFIDGNGFGLQNNDIINISDFTFTYNNNPQNFSQFNSPQRLINILNSGATGGLNSQGLFSLQNSVGVTGYLESNKISLFSLLRSGEDGNEIKVYKDTENPNAIKIHSRYFTGGKSLRPLISNWIGNFSNIFNLTIENSGFYTKQVTPIELLTTISGIAWVDNFSGNYLILTGFRDPRNPSNYSGSILNFNSNLNQYSGATVIPKNGLSIYTGFNIEIIKPNPYNIEGNFVKYIVSGKDFLFTDIIEG
jgi:hypothetical protein